MVSRVTNPGQTGSSGKTDAGANKLSSDSGRVSKSTNPKRKSSQVQAFISEAKKEATIEPTGELSWEEAHRNCLDMLDEADQGTRRLNATIVKERHEASTSIQKLRTELQQVTVDKEQAERRCGELENEVAQLKQQNETSIASSQGQVSWTEVQTILNGIQTNLLATAQSVSENKSMLENRQYSTFLPGSDVFQDHPLSQTAPSMGMGPYTLPSAPMTLPGAGWFGNGLIPNQPNMSTTAPHGAQA
ncbi:hypothetical protein N7478_003728 [Penicillium angulare]|uniref:uncharacterized protein n=1 Tax=Penicillium angulare TaxID=116970 RepID=UPI002540CCB9|nr:uncharacterized protein N7478_003728 [Penicillium angulare]KAJ5288042.1 hypothetical protein N7478_003728 [Penicillium angulare]